jgi:hypothetical protein
MGMRPWFGDRSITSFTNLPLSAWGLEQDINVKNKQDKNFECKNKGYKAQLSKQTRVKHFH